MNVFICSNYRGSIEYNTEHARRWCKEAIRLGYTPYAPHIYFTQFLRDEIEIEREQGINLGIEWLNLCNQLWVCSLRISDGMKQEIDYAKENGIEIVYMYEKLRSYSNE